LTDTSIEEPAFEQLHALKNLRLLTLETKSVIAPETIAALQTALPKCYIQVKAAKPKAPPAPSKSLPAAVEPA
jgi:hypothetical protein